MNLKQHKNSKHQKSKGKNIQVLEEYVRNNIKEYIIIITIFLIGVFLGVMFINNVEEIQKEEIQHNLQTV